MVNFQPSPGSNEELKYALGLRGLGVHGAKQTLRKPNKQKTKYK
jgi:hypothetical protein